ncbi:MAG TPA: phytanoyl-CoA dioxygenase family protein [Thermoanaerobaculia bacterium]|nr:phytanoyl-CoA dioxygenase family protein [Thermoanaerobaculia bacterium]
MSDLRLLTPAQRDAYDRDGFLVLEGFAPPDAVHALRVRATALVDGFDPADVVSIFSTKEQARTSDDYFLGSGDKIRFFFEEDAFDSEGNLRQAIELSINKIGHALHDLDSGFRTFSHDPRLADVAGDIGMRDPVALQSMYIFKQPWIGGEVSLHTDATFLYTDPITVVGFWFALEDATQENGCLWALPGGHSIPLKSRFRRLPGGGTGFEVLDQTPYPSEGLVPLEVPQGTLVLLHGLLPHRSAPNRSERSRHAYTLHAVEREAHYPADNWLQRSPELPLAGFA